MRASRERMFMDMARAASQRSTCFRLNVGAIAVDVDHRIVSMGYNGPPSGAPHCTGPSCEVDNVCVRAVHAEHNAILQAGDQIDRVHTVYVTHSPCPDCATLLLSYVSIKRVVFEEPYRKVAAIELLDNASITVHRLLPSNQLINAITKEFVDV